MRDLSNLTGEPLYNSALSAVLVDYSAHRSLSLSNATENFGDPTIPFGSTHPVPNPDRITLADARYLVWFRGRTTPVVVDAVDRSQAISKARAKAKRAGDRNVVEARQPTTAEHQKINRGDWVLTRPTGHENMRSDFGPNPRKH